MNLGGNMTEGDGYQKGGCLVVGRVLENEKLSHTLNQGLAFLFA